MEKKKFRNDLILIGAVLFIALASLITWFLIRKSYTSCVAKVYVQDTIVETIDLSKKEEKYYEIDGLKTKVKIHTKNGAIAIVESGCPHKDCVNMGYVSQPGKPIICAYNAVSIVLEGTSQDDVVV